MCDEFNFGLFKLPAWGCMVSLGVLILALLYITRLRKINVSEKTIDRIVIIGAIGGVFTYFGASFFDALWHCIGDAKITGTFEFDITNGGVTFEGGILSGMAAFFIFFPIIMKEDKRYSLYYMDQLIPGILIAHALGRIGCWCAGCCYGKEPTVEWLKWLAVNYPTDYGMRLVYPTQLMESAFLFICFFLFTFLMKKNLTERYFITYGVFRFCLEFFRGDDRGASPFGPLSPSQFMSIVMIVCGIICFVIRRIQYKKDLESQKSIEVTEEQPMLPVRYFVNDYQNFFKVLLHPSKCKTCGKRLAPKYKPNFVKANQLHQMNNPHLTYYCSKCQEFTEYENKESLESK